MNQTAAKSMSGVSASVEKPTSSVAGHARERSPSTMVYVPRRRGGIKRLHSHGAQGRAQLVERVRGRGRRLPGVDRRERAAQELDGGHQARRKPAGDRGGGRGGD